MWWYTARSKRGRVWSVRKRFATVVVVGSERYARGGRRATRAAAKDAAHEEQEQKGRNSEKDSDWANASSDDGHCAGMELWMLLLLFVLFIRRGSDGDGRDWCDGWDDTPVDDSEGGVASVHV